MLDRELLAETRRQLVGDLRIDRGGSTHWTGELAASSLSTATAVSALVLADRHGAAGADAPELIRGGVGYLDRHQLDDGGWGDTDRSRSNIATTLLALAARTLALPADNDPERDRSTARAWRYVEQQGSWDGLRARYGTDRTFVVPILTNCALAGLVPWQSVAALPFELACCPQSVYRFLSLPVVSYAIPALVAIGQARHHHLPSRIPPVRWLRQASIEPSLRVLDAMQPASGGFLEAIPLTAFVVMSLVSCRRSELPVVRQGVTFLRRGQRSDGSWPIDTDLATWVSSLSLHALWECDSLDPVRDAPAIDWLLSCQHRQRHRFTGADPGGWGWSDLSGAVPDADDTPAALLALHAWSATARSADAGPQGRLRAAAITDAVAGGVRWLLGLQNRDGGWPTFCRGWGTLPFDRSSCDLTGHAIRALHRWHSAVDPGLRPRITRAIDRGRKFLEAQQQPSGGWLPLWFGNQDLPDESNPWYGTARVLQAYADLGWAADPAAARAVAWLSASQNQDGGWGGGPSRRAIGEGRDASAAEWRNARSAADSHSASTIEETGLVLSGLLAVGGSRALAEPNIIRGVHWLCQAIRRREHRQAWPIGFYFAKLWYYERLYPIVFAAAAIGCGCRLAGLAAESSPDPSLRPSRLADPSVDP